MMTRVNVTRRLPTHVLEPLAAFEVGVWGGAGPVPREVLSAAVADADGLLTMFPDPIDREMLEAAPSLRVVSQMAVGVDNIDLGACRDRGIDVGYTPGVLTETVADHAFALLLSAVRRLAEGHAEVRAGEWSHWEPFHLAGGDLHGSTLGVIGMGRIGQAIARRAQGFDMEVIYTSRSSEAPIGRRVDLSDLLTRSDHVVVAAALTHETEGLIGRAELKQMKPTAYLVNVARGPLVDTDALVDALQSGSIAGAALDVTDPEPLPGGHPLIEQPNCLIVPHMGSASVATHTRMAELAVQNLVAGLAGKPLPQPVPDGL